MQSSWLVALTLSAGGILAAGATAEQVDFFERQVRPVLAQHCYACHSSRAKAAFAGLRLDSRDGVIKGSDAGPVVVNGRPSESKLIRALRGELPSRMPPSGKLADDQISALAKWIEMGTPWPGETAPAPAALAAFNLEERKREHWAWQPVRQVKPPAVRDAHWPLQPTDLFVLARLESRGATPAAPATRSAWLRRVTFDLTGLPPTPAEIAAFESDTGESGGYESVVDRLLASPRFGERWARRWMDLVRFAESHGSEGDPDIPEAWRYRDYLIRAFNSDVPYDQLIREHLAGDLLPKPRTNAAEHINESRIGVANLRMVEHGFQPVDPWEDRIKWTDNQVDVFSKAFQGLTVSCARCHDHKFDAISQKDFYALFGIFANARPTQAAIDDDAYLNTNRAELTRLKGQIKERLASAWTKALETAAVPDWKFAASNPRGGWDLTAEWKNWRVHGAGLSQGPSPPGEFAVATEGDRVIGGIYPAGVYTHLLSSKHSGVATSPRFRIETDFISILMAGANFSFAQLIIENYAVPRGGIYNLRFSPTKDSLDWFRWDVKFWKGFTGYIEFATMDDVTHFQANGKDAAPLRNGRSWFGAREVVFHNDEAPPKAEPRGAGTTVAQAVEAWGHGRASEEQAALLDHLVRCGVLPNSSESVPGVAALLAEYRKLEGEVPVPRRAPGVLEEAGGDQTLLVRGDFKRPGDPVPRRYLTALGSHPYTDPAHMRLRLADEVASPSNPLTARVMVNRIWQNLFRKGIVQTVDNFGKLGEPPSDPELLDWLAGRFVADGWSIKKLVRMLATSRAYRMAANEVMPMRRLEAEELRDTILAVSGQLDPKMYGPSVPVYYSHETGKTKGDKPKGPLDGNRRRTVYLEIRRNATNPFLEVFDAPKPSTTRGQRDVTNVPAQSLALMNSSFVIEQAAKWGERGEDVDTMFLRALGRKATPQERDEAASYLARSGAAGSSRGDLAQVIFSLKEFLYVR